MKRDPFFLLISDRFILRLLLLSFYVLLLFEDTHTYRVPTATKYYVFTALIIPQELLRKGA